MKISAFDWSIAHILHTWKIAALILISGDENGNEPESTEKKISTIHVYATDRTIP